jgi:hypothetical protein
MLDQFKNVSRKRMQALLAALVALVAAITGCDKKVAWRGVTTDNSDHGQAATIVAPPGESPNGQSR